MRFCGAQVLDRALRTGAGILKASNADEASAIVAGDPLDEMETAANR
jgi:hypothetical protein